MKSYIIVAVTALFAVTSCNLDYAPENIMVDETVFKEAKTAEAALLGAYTRFNNSFAGAPTGINAYSESGYLHYFGEIGTPTLKVRDTGPYVTMETSDYITDEGFILEIWKRCYNAIDYTNNIITNITKYGDYDKKIMAQHMAEAKFLRAFTYLHLLQAFGDGALTGEMDGLGVIMRLTPYDGYNPEDIQSRGTVGEAYAQIIKDITEALPNLPNKTVTDMIGKSRASKTAAHALLARIYLYKGTFKNNVEELQLAANYADSVLQNKQGFKYSTSNGDYLSNMFIYNEFNAETDKSTTSTESILIEPSYSKVLNYGNGLNGYFDKVSFFIDKNFADIYDATDLRGTLGNPGVNTSLIWTGSDQFIELTSFKYNNKVGYNNVQILRLAEAKFIRAEALARLTGINPESLTILNEVYKKPYKTPKPADLTVADFTDDNDFINRILTEKLKELAHEGNTRYDYIRTNRPLRVNTIPSNRKILPIPDYEIRISYGVIKQNTGYTNK